MQWVTVMTMEYIWEIGEAVPMTSIQVVRLRALPTVLKDAKLVEEVLPATHQMLVKTAWMPSTVHTRATQLCNVFRVAMV
jgi:hypothetical protein